jgi:hypothetical protein
METYSNDDILHKLMNTNLNTYSDGELIRRAAEEIKKLRAAVADLDRRNSELCSRVEELLREKLNDSRR